MPPEKLAYKANQIGKFFAHQGEERAATSIARHIAKFWDPRMRAALLEYARAGGASLDPVVMRAVVREACCCASASPIPLK